VRNGLEAEKVTGQKEFFSSLPTENRQGAEANRKCEVLKAGGFLLVGKEVGFRPCLREIKQGGGRIFKRRCCNDSPERDLWGEKEGGVTDLSGEGRSSIMS